MLRMMGTLADIVPSCRTNSALPHPRVVIATIPVGGAVWPALAPNLAKKPEAQGKVATWLWARVLFRLTNQILSCFGYRY